MIKGLVSVIIPVYNRQDYVEETLVSVVNQTYKNIEVIVINDGSTDESESIINQYATNYPGVVKLINQKNQGQVIARNNGLKQANGEFVAFLDSDDLWLPGKIEKQLPLFVNNVGLVYSGVQYINADGKNIGDEPCEREIKGSVYKDLIVKNRMTGGTVVVRSEALEKVGLFDEELKAAENWDLWLRISQAYDVDFVDELLLKYRKHEFNMSLDNTLMLGATYRVLEKNCLEVETKGSVQSACAIAEANYYYRVGIYLTSKGEYVEARFNFRKAVKLVPNYLDCNIRIIRSYLGKTLNHFISNLAKRVKRQLSNR